MVICKQILCFRIVKFFVKYLFLQEIKYLKLQKNLKFLILFRIANIFTFNKSLKN